MNGQTFSELNVYQMAERHGGSGFWITRTTWRNTVAHVVGIGEITGPPPYFGNPVVVMDVYATNGNIREELVRLETAGTYKTWRYIDIPDWAQAEQWRPLDHPEIAAALAKFDRRRSRPKMQEVEEKCFLTVPYERKDKAKAIGARWDPLQKKWWIRANDETAIKKATLLDFL